MLACEILSGVGLVSPRGQPSAHRCCNARSRSGQRPETGGNMRLTGPTRTRRCSFVLMTLALANWLASLALPATGSARSTDSAGLEILILQGKNGVNNVKKKTAVRPVVEVRDRNNLPVADATVTFFAPDWGPRVTFTHGSRVFTTVTDASGRATVPSMKPVGTGTFKIGVTASFHGQLASAAIAQTNILVAAGAAAGLSTTAIAAIVGGAAAAAGVAVAAGSKGGG